MKWSLTPTKDDPAKSIYDASLLEMSGVLSEIGESSLYSVYSIYAALAPPVKPNTYDSSYLKYRMDLWGLNPKDKADILKALSSEKIKFSTLSEIQPHAGFEDWIKALHESRTQSAGSTIWLIYRTCKESSTTDVGPLLDRLDAATDWEDPNIIEAQMCLGYLPNPHVNSVPGRKGNKDDGIRFLRIIKKHATGRDRYMADLQLSRWTGEPPSPLEGEDAKNSSLWRAYGNNLKGNEKTEEARSAYLKAEEVAETKEDRGYALESLAEIDPDTAFDHISKAMPDLANRDKSKPSTMPVSINHALYRIVQQRPELAVKCVALMDSLIDPAYGISDITAKARAVVRFWAGDIKGGVSILSKVFEKPQDGFVIASEVYLQKDIPTKARTALGKEMMKHLKTNKVPLASISHGTQSIRDASPEGVKAYSDLLINYIKESDISLDDEFLGRMSGWLYSWVMTDKNSNIAKIWYPVVETAYNKAGKTPGDRKRLGELLQKRMDDYPDTQFKKTENYQMLQTLANTLKGG